jgi:hypothetical protein
MNEHAVRCWIYHDAFGRATDAEGPVLANTDQLPDAILTPAPTLPEQIAVPETEERADESAYRRPTDTLPFILGMDQAPTVPPDDLHRQPPE